MEKHKIELGIETLENQITELKRELAILRKEHSREEMPDYLFENWKGGQTKLSELFGDKDELIVIHNMGKSCPYCTLWADGFNGVVSHLENRAGFVVISNDAPEVQKIFAESRGWKFKMVSSGKNTFKKDLGFYGPNNGKEIPLPGMSTFLKEDGKIYHIAKASFGPGDSYCPTWDMFDLLANSDMKWQPKFGY